MPGRRKPSNYALLFPYVLPYFAYVGALMIPPERLPRAAAYGVALAGSGAALAWGWRWLLPLRGTGSPVASAAAGAAAGVVGTALWVAIKAPFYAAGGEPWPEGAFWMRLLASGTVVAVFEELLFRGYLLCGAVQWSRARRAGSPDPIGEVLHQRSVADVEPGAWTPFAVLFSSLVFAGGHAPGEWPAALAYGLLMAGLWIWRKDLLTCVIAHGTTNVTLALWVRHTADWTLW
jgi:CAAX protease family protein